MSYHDDGPYEGRHGIAYEDTLGTPTNALTWLTNAAGALASVALVVGVGFWGYKLMVRDVSGIPIVRAMEGEMRVRPDDPGGDVAQHQGLAVNEIAASGGASAPPDRLVLAPQPVRLTDEDLPMNAESVAMVQQAIAAQDERADAPDAAQDGAERIAAAAQSGSVDDLVAALTEGMTPMQTQEEQVVQAALQLPQAAALRDLPGVRQSIRPRLRPAAPAAMAAPATLAALQGAIDPAGLPAGTRLAQLGAYDSIEVAQVEWAKFSARFPDLMAGKRQVVQQASSGGRSFYRLRVHGFDDLSQARRFCSALVAEGADCIPVVTR